MKNLKVGDRIKFGHGSVYMLVNDAYKQVFFVNLESGYLSLSFSVDNPLDITYDEFRQTGYTKSDWTYEDGSPIYPEETYSVGQRFKTTYDEEYILAQVDLRKVTMISLSNGNRYEDPIDVDDPQRITREDLNKISRDFVLIK